MSNGERDSFCGTACAAAAAAAAAKGRSALVGYLLQIQPLPGNFSGAIATVNRMAVRETVLQRVHRTCTEAVEALHADVHLCDVAIEAIAAELATPAAAAAVAASCSFTKLPIRFEDVQSEVNAMALFHLLDLGSGYDDFLLAMTGKGAVHAALTP